MDSPMNCVMSKPVRTSTNKNKCPIYCVCVSKHFSHFRSGHLKGGG